MKNAEKIMREDNIKRDSVKKILEMLNGERYSDAKIVLDLAAHYLKENTYLDAELAKKEIDFAVSE